MIVGGGPAGAILGAYLARAGIDHSILDKAVHPRPHVGESLLCATTRVFQEIGFLEAIERGSFVRKHGALWTHFAEPRPVALPFRPIPHLGIEQPWSWHVDRSRFDDALLRHAAGAGLAGAGGRAGRARRARRRPAARWASWSATARAAAWCAPGSWSTRPGAARCSGRQLRLMRTDPSFRQFAVHGWFEGVDRGAADTAEWIHLHVLPGPAGLGLADPDQRGRHLGRHRLRVRGLPEGGSGPRALLLGGGRLEPGAGAAHGGRAPAPRAPARGQLQLCDGAPRGRRLAAGRRRGALRRSALLVGSLGGRGVRARRGRRDRGRARLGRRLGRRLRRLRAPPAPGLDVWREFIGLYYRLPRAFLSLLADPGDRELLREVLQGDVYQGGPFPGLERLRAEIARVESDPAHPWRAELDESAAKILAVR